MFYYQHHIGDYLSHTANLSLLEHGVYTRLLQTYYMTEKPIPLDDPWRTVGARDSAERSAVEYVLNTFFNKTDNGFVQTRCDKELLSYKEKSRKATESINSRWKNHKKDTNVIRTNNERNTEVILTNNQEPITNKPKKNTSEVDSAFFETFWKSYPRKNNKGAAKKLFNKLNPDEFTVKRMLVAIEYQSKSEQWKNPQFIPHAKTWLGNEGWEDEIELSPADKQHEYLRTISK